MRKLSAHSDILTTCPKLTLTWLMAICCTLGGPVNPGFIPACQQYPLHSRLKKPKIAITMMDFASILFLSTGKCTHTIGKMCISLLDENDLEHDAVRGSCASSAVNCAKKNDVWAADLDTQDLPGYSQFLEGSGAQPVFSLLSLSQPKNIFSSVFNSDFHTRVTLSGFLVCSNLKFSSLSPTTRLAFLDSDSLQACCYVTHSHSTEYKNLVCRA